MKEKQFFLSVLTFQNSTYDYPSLVVHHYYAAKQILMVTFLWVLPTWTLLLLVASGVLKLPFSIPFLDNLIM